MSKKSEALLKELEKQKKQIDRHEEYMAKKKFEKKPKALRRFERYERMGEQLSNDDESSK